MRVVGSGLTVARFVYKQRFAFFFIGIRHPPNLIHTCHTTQSDNVSELQFDKSSPPISTAIDE